jgi:F-type H+-transporting ATPase subunit epsilon
VNAFQVTLVTQEQILFDGQATEVQIPALDGYMGFRPGHAPMLSVLGIGILTCKHAGDPDVIFAISGGGYFEMLGERMIILADVAEPLSAIDIDRAFKAKERALMKLTGKDPGDWDVDRARNALARAMNRIRAHSLMGQ